MKKRNEELYLKDILEAISHIQAYTKNISYSQFSSDQMKIDAVVRNLEIIGEAVKKLDMAYRESHPSVEWKAVAGMRDKLIHHYMGVDYHLVWDVIENQVPGLKANVETLLDQTG